MTPPTVINHVADYFRTATTAGASKPDATRELQVDLLVKSLLLVNVWGKLDGIAHLAAHASQASLIDLRDPTRTYSAVNTPTFDANRGYTGNGTSSYINTNVNASTGTWKYLNNDCHLGVYVLTATTSTGRDLGTDTGNATRLMVRTGTEGFSLNGNNPVSPALTDTFPAYVCITRADGTNIKYSANGDATTSAASASTGITNTTFTIGKGNTFFSDRQIAIAHWGGALTDAEIAATYAAFRQYLLAIGAVT